MLAAPRPAARPPAPPAPSTAGKIEAAGAKLAASSAGIAGASLHWRSRRRSETTVSAEPFLDVAPVFTTQTQDPSCRSARETTAVPASPVLSTLTEHFPASAAPCAKARAGRASAERMLPVAATPAVTRPAVARAVVKYPATPNSGKSLSLSAYHRWNFLVKRKRSQECRNLRRFPRIDAALQQSIGAIMHHHAQGAQDDHHIAPQGPAVLVFQIGLQAGGKI